MGELKMENINYFQIHQDWTFSENTFAFVLLPQFYVSDLIYTSFTNKLENYFQFYNMATNPKQ